MNMFKEEWKKEKDEFKALGGKSLRRSFYTGEQTGTSNKKVDEKRKALAPGKRRSKTGKIYYEYRKSRSDKVGSMV